MIKVGDRVRAVEGKGICFAAGDRGCVEFVDDFGRALVQFDASPTVTHDGRWYTCLSQIEPIHPLQVPPNDWTPHDRYTAAALTGLLARGGDTVPIGGFVAVARQIADEAMAARGGR